MPELDRQLVEARRRVQEREQTDLVAWHRLSGVTPETLELTKHYEALASNAKKAANGALMRIQHLAADDTVPIESRRRQAREALAKASADVKDIERAMETTLLIMKATLEQAALPRLDPAREPLARDEVRTRLAGSADLIGGLYELAQGDDELAGVVTRGTFAESFLRGQGVGAKEAKEAAASIQRVAAASAVQSADPDRKAVGESLAAFGPTLADGACTFAVVRDTLSDAAADAQALGAVVVGV